MFARADSEKDFTAHIRPRVAIRRRRAAVGFNFLWIRIFHVSNSPPGSVALPWEFAWIPLCCAGRGLAVGEVAVAEPAARLGSDKQGVEPVVGLLAGTEVDVVSTSVPWRVVVDAIA
jgi:hypothetical protein